MTQKEPRYMLGFESLKNEVSDVSLEIKGELPDWLGGTLVRNGPGTFEVGGEQLNHWFDGLAMLHAFTIDGENNSVLYSNRSLRTDAYTHAIEEGELKYSEFATDPCRDIFERFFALFDPEITDNAAVNIGKLAGRFVAMTETPMPVEFDPETLETIGKNDIGIPDGDISTAHPHFDVEKGVTLNYVTKLRPFSHKYRIYSVTDLPIDDLDRDDKEMDSEFEVIAEVPVDKPRYMHSFGMTENYVVLAEFPLTVSLLRLALGGGPFIESYEWEPELGTRFTVVDRSTGEVVCRPTSDAFFAFHHVNAYEVEGNDGGTVVVDVAAYEDSSVIDDFYLDEVMSADSELPGGDLRRYEISIAEDEVDEEVLYRGNIELPRINYPDYNGKEYRYAYGVGNRNDPPKDFPNKLIKVDIKSGDTKSWSEKGTYPGEPVFIQSPNSDGEEDEGVILSVVLDSESRDSFLLCLDASTFDEIARARTPHAVPFGFHGQFLS